MKIRTLALIAVCGTATWGCGSEPEPEPESTAGAGDGNDASNSAAAAGAAQSAAPAAAGLVDRALVDACAGFNAEKAAALLGLDAAALEVMETFSDRIDSQICRYWSAESNVGPGIDIMLNVQESSDAARRILEGQRSVVPRVDAVPPTGPALVEYDFGDEAFWDTNTGGVNVRVRNVVVTVHASTASNAMSDRDAGQIELERRVAEDVAAALE